MKIKIPSNESLRDYQVEGVEHLMSGQKKLLLDDPGLGKTAQAIVAARSLGARRVLVICPPGTRWTWEEQVERWAPDKYLTQVLIGEMCWIDPKTTCLIVSYSLLNSPNTSSTPGYGYSPYPVNTRYLRTSFLKEPL